MNLEESDALVGIGFLQMPTTREGLYASTAEAFAAQTISDRAGTTGQRIGGRTVDDYVGSDIYSRPWAMTTSRWYGCMAR